MFHCVLLSNSALVVVLHFSYVEESSINVKNNPDKCNKCNKPKGCGCVNILQPLEEIRMMQLD